MVTTNPSSWTASSNPSWLTVSPATGRRGARATSKVTANTAAASRTGVVTFSAGGKTATVTVTQAGARTILGHAPARPGKVGKREESDTARDGMA
ncbi:MAG: BACON domain-containing protein [Azoarcus sp.]|jgi:phage tail sheath gpL-like|nr:BACON domain-containing protein [Azoarcus sp.]